MVPLSLDELTVVEAEREIKLSEMQGRALTIGIPRSDYQATH